jgi:hypothetical protein
MLKHSSRTPAVERLDVAVASGFAGGMNDSPDALPGPVSRQADHHQLCPPRAGRTMSDFATPVPASPPYSDQRSRHGVWSSRLRPHTHCQPFLDGVSGLHPRRPRGHTRHLRATSANFDPSPPPCAQTAARSSLDTSIPGSMSGPAKRCPSTGLTPPPHSPAQHVLRNLSTERTRVTTQCSDRRRADETAALAAPCCRSSSADFRPKRFRGLDAAERSSG